MTPERRQRPRNHLQNGNCGERRLFSDFLTDSGLCQVLLGGQREHSGNTAGIQREFGPDSGNTAGIWTAGIQREYSGNSAGISPGRGKAAKTRFWTKKRLSLTIMVDLRRKTNSGVPPACLPGLEA